MVFKQSRGDKDPSSASEDESSSQFEELGSEEEDAEQRDGQSDGQSEGRRDDEMEELEREYSSLRDREEDLLKSLTRLKDEDVLKGQAVKNQKVVWDKTLELRCLLQKPFLSSNKLPQESLRTLFCNSDKAVNNAYSELINSSEETLSCLLELQEALLQRNPSITSKPNSATKEDDHAQDTSNSSDVEIDEEWSQIQRMYCRIAPFRDSSIDKWQRKTQVAIGAAAFKGKLHAFNQNISHQVASYMKDPSKMMKRMQLRRSTVGIFGEAHEEAKNSTEEDANGGGDPVLLDDSEFYHQLLKEFIDSCDPTSSASAFYALRKTQPKKRKVVDRRASKSRKIRYNVHEKIVNFMASEPINLPPMAPKLFENLFGLKKQKSASVA